MTVEEVDEFLDKIASGYPGSGEKVKSKYQGVDVNTELRDVYNLRVSPNEGKWLTRLILKDMSPLWFREWDLLGKFHESLPSMLKIYDDLEHAVPFLRDPAFAPTSELRIKEDRVKVFSSILPQIGTKVGTPFFFKGLNLDYIVDVAQKRRMALEQKFDGEYCQIHVSVNGKRSKIQIFSKSGRDSTSDRALVHSAIRKCLGLEPGVSKRKFSKSCILVGELVAWDEKKEQVLGFDKVRSHLRQRTHGYVKAGNHAASISRGNLLIKYFDVLDVDSKPVIHESYFRRRERLQHLITPL